MFSIIISEKGGAERRETFEKNEINVGRVQGNDLMLPKGNVSKHHARLLFRDGRFIVTDLKSTNGTYVNGRKIAQATIVREGDKIYIGDFVLRLDAGNGADAAPNADDESVRTLARNNPAAPAPNAPAGGPNPAIPQALRAPAPAPTPPPAQAYAEREEEEAPPPPKPVQAAPVPRAAPGGGGAPVPRNNQTLQIPGGNQRAAAAAAAPVQRSAAAVAAPLPAAPAPTSPAAQAQTLNPPVVIPTAAPRVAPRETPTQAGNRLALITLVDRIADAVDLSPLRASPNVDEALSQSVERAAREQASAMRDEGEAPEGIDLEALARDAVRELLGLGAIGALLDEDEVIEIQCVRNDQVLVHRGNALMHAGASYTSDEALGRAIARLAHQSGDPVKPGELVIERRLPRGAQMIAIAPPAAAAHAVVIRKRRKVDATLEDLVRSGALSRPMAVFLDACIQARANVLACAPAGTSTAQLVAALASAAPPGERIALLSDVEEVQIPHAHVVALSLADSRAKAADEVVRAAARLRPDRLILSSIPTGATASLVEAISEGAEGVIAAGAAPSLRQLLARFASQLVLSRPGLDVEAARESISEAFDVAVEMTTLADGRARILRIAELGFNDGKGPRDIFVFVPEPSGEGTFQSTGAQPRAIADFATRGVKLDPAMFKRTR
ncbi:MAG: ATPase, T2SS/T4P/T4SS family [Polyangiaceae bacterium]